MSRAKEALEDAGILANAGRWNACVNRLYYACFYGVSALLVRHGLSSSKHAGVRSLFNRQYVKTGKIPKDLAHIYNDLFERRQEGDYIDFVRFQESQVLPWIPKPEQLIRYITSMVENEIS
ncbi:MAG: HEPN domain-containing protein [Deltaproteobacteria bacterium]|nr:HEPN domain-containing protein [Deltaproteobacteria bacterium]MBW2070791.1 HEPN domain-containing protein [Deltaproteobacteria bacterium]